MIPPPPPPMKMDMTITTGSIHVEAEIYTRKELNKLIEVLQALEKTETYWNERQS